MPKALIYIPTKTAMQSGTANTQKWLLEYVPDANPHYIDPLMGWTGGTDTTRQLKLYFDTSEAAIKYAEAHAIPFEVKLPKIRKKIPKSYADNFRYDKIEA